ncbi:hypothetical protein AOLI_G00080650 [Acnodon oligacanthus]
MDDLSSAQLNFLTLRPTKEEKIKALLLPDMQYADLCSYSVTERAQSLSVGRKVRTAHQAGPLRIALQASVGATPAQGHVSDVCWSVISTADVVSLGSDATPFPFRQIPPGHLSTSHPLSVHIYGQFPQLLD